MAEPMVSIFYGFKGGTGRSFLLASCATALAAMGQRVLVMDWDLEAPGVGDLFDASGNDVAQRWRRHLGTVDLFLDQSFPPYSEDSSDAAVRLRDLLFNDDTRRPDERYVIDVVRSIDLPGRLSLIGPGRHQNSTQYFERLLDINWTWYFEHDGAAFLRLLRSALKTQRQFDHVLIDGRTGYSQSAVAAIRFLADYVCVVGTYSFQALDGIARVWPLFEAAEPGASVGRKLVLARKPTVTDAKQSADFEGKGELLDWFGIAASDRLVLPIVANLHGGDGHLWSRYELFEQAGESVPSPSHTGQESRSCELQGPDSAALTGYLQGLSQLLRDVFGVVSMDGPQGSASDDTAPLTWIPRWWREFGDTKFWSKEYNLSTATWEQQRKALDDVLAAITTYIKSPIDQPRLIRPQRPVDGPEQGQEDAVSVVEPWLSPSEQTYRSLTARALLAVRASEAVANAVRPDTVSELTWRERQSGIRQHFGLDLSPVSRALSRRADSAAGQPREVEPVAGHGDNKSADQIDGWETLSANVAWGIAQWFDDETLRRIAHAFSGATVSEAPFSDSEDQRRALRLQVLAGSIVEMGARLGRVTEPFTHSWLRERCLVIVRRLLATPQRTERGPARVAEIVQVHRGIAFLVESLGTEDEDAVQALMQAEGRQLLSSNILTQLEQRPQRRRRERALYDALEMWSEDCLIGQLKMASALSAERASGAALVRKVTTAFARRLGAVKAGTQAAEVVGTCGDLIGALGVLCRSAHMAEVAVPLLLAAIRVAGGRASSLVIGLELCLELLRAPSAYRASLEYSKRLRSELADVDSHRAATSDWRVRAALRREWWAFGYGFSRVDVELREQYGSYREALAGLEAWTSEVASEPGSVMRETERLVERHKRAYRLELGDMATLSGQLEEHVSWPCAQRTRLYLALGRCDEALHVASKGLQREPVGLRNDDPEAFSFARLHLLETLASSIDGSRDAQTLFEEAKWAIQVLVDRTRARSFPFDKRLETWLSKTGERAVGSELLGLSAGDEWPALFRVEIATCHVEYAEICIRCGQASEALAAAEFALGCLGIDESDNVPPLTFVGPLSVRAALPAAQALAVKSKVVDSRSAEATLSAAIKWAEWDCLPENHGGGRAVYHRRHLLWASADPAWQQRVSLLGGQR